MSYDTRKPNLKLVISDDWFNLLLSALTENSKLTLYPNTVERATALMEKLMKYSRPYTEDDMNCVDIRFFPNEASEMIWQLLVQCGCFLEPADNFYHQLVENHVLKGKKIEENQSERSMQE